VTTPRRSPSSPSASRRPRSSFDVDDKRSKAAELERDASDPSLWDDPARGQQLTTALARLRAEIERYDGLVRHLEDARTMDELLQSETDPEMSKELARSVRQLGRDVEKLELATLLGGEYDDHDAVATLHAGAGGTESQDWAEMLLRMYLRWAERERLDVEVDETLLGDEAGIKSATFIVHGPYAYGLLSAERGVHRLVRISPFDAQKRRHTSFANLDVIPLLEETGGEDIEIDPRTCGSTSTARPDRAGSPSTRRTPRCGSRTSQRDHGGVPERALAVAEPGRWRCGSSRPAGRADAAGAADQAREPAGERKGIDFGSQIRSYVLAPYRLVKDHRTNVEIGDVDRVLDGDLEGAGRGGAAPSGPESVGSSGTEARPPSFALGLWSPFAPSEAEIMPRRLAAGYEAGRISHRGRGLDVVREDQAWPRDLDHRRLRAGAAAGRCRPRLLGGTASAKQFATLRLLAAGCRADRQRRIRDGRRWHVAPRRAIPSEPVPMGEHRSNTSTGASRVSTSIRRSRS
jgi:peptide chain release factor 2